jgi:hypothetical protein
MARKVTIWGTKREQVDKEKLAIAFLMLAKILHEQKQDGDTGLPDADDRTGGEAEAA